MRNLEKAKAGTVMIERSFPYAGLLHEVVEHNGVLYFGGIVAENTSLDMTGQANDVFDQLAHLLNARGSDLSNVLQVTIFVTDLGAKAQLNARAVVGVADLGAGEKLEMTAIARASSRSSTAANSRS